MKRMPLAYEKPFFYDKAFEWDCTNEVDFYEECFRQFSRIDVRRILEPGCGSGRITNEIVKRGYMYYGYDLSAEMIRFAIRKHQGLKNIRFFIGDMKEFIPPVKCDAAINTITTFSYIIKDRDILSHLKSIKESLNPGGLYIIDFSYFHNTFEDGINEWEFTIDERPYNAIYKLDKADMKNMTQTESFTVLNSEGGTEIKSKHIKRLWIFNDFIQMVSSLKGIELCGYFSSDNYKRLTEKEARESKDNIIHILRFA